MPVKFGGLWSGARADHFSIAASTESVMSVGAVKSVPPCTTRCPTTAIGMRSAVSSGMTRASPAAWSGSDSSDSFCEEPGSLCDLCVIAPCVLPMRSTRPLATRATPELLPAPTVKSPYFSDDEPAFSTKARDDRRRMEPVCPTHTRARCASVNLPRILSSHPDDTCAKRKIVLCAEAGPVQCPNFWTNDVRPSTVRDRLGRDQLSQIQAKRCMMGTEL